MSGGGFLVPQSIVDSLSEPGFNARYWPEIRINLSTGERTLTGREWSLVHGWRPAVQDTEKK